MTVDELIARLQQHDGGRIVSIMYLGDDAGEVDVFDSFTVATIEDDLTFDDDPDNDDDVPGVCITLKRREEVA